MDAEARYPGGFVLAAALRFLRRVGTPSGGGQERGGLLSARTFHAWTDPQRLRVVLSFPRAVPWPTARILGTAGVPVVVDLESVPPLARVSPPRGF